MRHRIHGRAVVLLATLALAGCADLALPGGGGHACLGSTLDAEWIEPGLHDRLEGATVEGATVSAKEPPEPRIRNATLEALWGPVGLAQVSYRPGPAGGMNEATLAHESWGGDGGPLYLGVTADARESQETALGFADALLARLGVPEASRRAHLDALRDAWEPAPPGVANHVSARLEAPVDWDAAPGMLFVNGTEERWTHGGMRDLREGPWSLAVRVGARTLDATVDGRTVHLEVAPDDRVVAFVQVAEAEPLAPALARINATLARAGAPHATFQDYEGAQMAC